MLEAFPHVFDAVKMRQALNKFDPQKDIHQGPVSARSQRKAMKPSQDGGGSSQSHSQMTFESINNRTIEDVVPPIIGNQHSNSFEMPKSSADNTS